MQNKHSYLIHIFDFHKISRPNMKEIVALPTVIAFTLSDTGI